MSDINISFGADTAGVQSALAILRQSFRQTSVGITQNFSTINNSINETKKSVLQFGSELSMCLHGLKSVGNFLKTALSAPLSQFSRYEDAATRLAPLVGSLDAARAIADKLRDSAANGTMSLEQLTSVAGRLASVFKSRDEILQWTEAFHNLGAGTGLDVNELVGQFTKAKASGRFEAGFLDMFAQKSVNLYAPIAKELKMSAAEIRKLARAGELEFGKVSDAILACTTGTGQFAGAAEAMSGTFSGSLDTLREQWNTLLAEFGKPFAEALTPWLKSAAGLFASGKEGASGFGRAVKDFAVVAVPAAIALTAVKVAIMGINAAMAANPFMLAATGLALVASVAYSAFSGMESYGEKLAEKNRELASTVEELRAAYAALDSSAALQSRYAADSDALAKEEEEFRYANPYFDEEEAKRAAALVELNEKGAPPEFLRSLFGADDRFAEKAGYSSYDNMKDRADTWHAFSAIKTRREEIEQLREKRSAELEVAEAAKKSAEAEAAKAEAAKKAAELSKKAAERLAEIEKAQAAKAIEAKVSAAAPEARAQTLLEESGYGSVWALDRAIEMKRGDVEVAKGYGELTSEMVEDWRELVALRERANKLAEDAAKQEAAAQERLARANTAYEERAALLDAELRGNTALKERLEERARANKLAAEYEASGMDPETAATRAAEIVAKESAAAELRRPAGTPLGSGRVADELASVGGGRSLNLGGNGENPVLRAAQASLGVQQKMRDLLAAISENTARAPAASYA